MTIYTFTEILKFLEKADNTATNRMAVTELDAQLKRFVDGVLSQEERNRLTSRMLQAPEMKQRLLEFIRAEQDTPRTEPTRKAKYDN